MLREISHVTTVEHSHIERYYNIAEQYGTKEYREFAFFFFGVTVQLRVGSTLRHGEGAQLPP